MITLSVIEVALIVIGCGAAGYSLASARAAGERERLDERVIELEDRLETAETVIDELIEESEVWRAEDAQRLSGKGVSAWH